MNPSHPQHPFQTFFDFYSNHHIHMLADIPKWTLSTSEKMPVDMHALRATGRITGARHGDDGHYQQLRLPELVATIPTATNNAFYLEGHRDGFIVIDIEPSCPHSVRDTLLRITAPYNPWVETSMSGRGVHILMPMPALIAQHPVGKVKSVLIHPGRWYEVLIDHWITFTRTPYTAPVAPPEDNPGLFEASFTTFDQWCQHLLDNTPTTSVSSRGVTVDAGDISELSDDELLDDAYSQINRVIVERAERAVISGYSDRDLAYYDDDHSRFEFARINHIIRCLDYEVTHALMDASQGMGADYTITQERFIKMALYLIRHLIPERDKHHTYRGGQPYLLAQLERALSDYRHLAYLETS